MTAGLFAPFPAKDLGRGFTRKWLRSWEDRQATNPRVRPRFRPGYPDQAQSAEPLRYP